MKNMYKKKISFDVQNIYIYTYLRIVQICQQNFFQDIYLIYKKMYLFSSSCVDLSPFILFINVEGFQFNETSLFEFSTLLIHLVYIFDIFRINFLLSWFMLYWYSTLLVGSFHLDFSQTEIDIDFHKMMVIHEFSAISLQYLQID